MQIESRNIADLLPYPNNAKLHSEEQITKIAASIKEFGFNNPVLIDQDGGIIAGHGRVDAARKLNLSDVPTITLAHLTEAQKKAYILADNRLSEIGSEWDLDLVSIELEGLLDLDMDIDLTGFDDSWLQVEEAEGLTDEDEVPEIPETPISVEGDLWTLGSHRLLCGDATSIDAVERLMKGEKADMVFTDPPYGMKLDADWSKAKSSLKFATDKNALGGKKHKNVIGDHDDFTPELINTIFACFDYCKEIFLWGADYYAEHLPNKNEGSWVVWDKRLDESADKMYGSTFELCWSKARHKRMLARIKWAGIFGTEKEFDHKRHHPTQKPVALNEWFFDYYSLKNKIVVADLYGGAGGTLIACEKTNRNCRMMELDPQYIDVIINRWQNFTGKDAVHESGNTYNEMKQQRDAA